MRRKISRVKSSSLT